MADKSTPLNKPMDSKAGPSAYVNEAFSMEGDLSRKK